MGPEADKVGLACTVSSVSMVCLTCENRARPIEFIFHFILFSFSFNPVIMYNI